MPALRSSRPTIQKFSASTDKSSVRGKQRYVLYWDRPRHLCGEAAADGRNGSIANIVSREYPIAFPHPGWSEQDPADWWAAVCDGIPALLDGFDASQVKGIGAGGQMHGLVVLDKNDTVIRPCILWNDGRTQRQVDYLNGVIGKDKLSRYTANIAFAGFTAPKLLWMQENEPDNFARIEKNHAAEGLHQL